VSRSTPFANLTATEEHRMGLRHFVTHKISKELQEPAATLLCSEQETDLDNDAVAHCYAQTAAQLKRILPQRSSQRYGVFHPEITYARAQIQDWLRERQSFIALTRRLSKHFANALDNTELAVDGYLAFFMQ